MSLGACTSMTLRQYAKRKGYALKDVQVRLRHERARDRLPGGAGIARDRLTTSRGSSC